MTRDAPDRLEVGRIGRPHGLRGDVTVVMVSDRPERTEPGTTLFADERPLVIESARPVRAGWVIRFRGVDDRDAAEALRGAVLSAEPLDVDDVFAHDLIGCAVEDTNGRALGTVTAIQPNPAHDLLVLEDGALVPIVFLVTNEPGRVVVDPPEGLFDH